MRDFSHAEHPSRPATPTEMVELLKHESALFNPDHHEHQVMRQFGMHLGNVGPNAKEPVNGCE